MYLFWEKLTEYIRSLARSQVKTLISLKDFPNDQ